MGWLLRFYNSSIGGKVVMAVTGLLLLGFLVGHLAGNLLVYVGREELNAYAQFLKESPLILWCARIGLLVVFGLHIITGLRLAAANRAARPVPYAHDATVQASRASRHMVLSGLVVLAYVIYHVLHFTLGVVDPEGFRQVEDLGGGRQRHDVYAMVVDGFRNSDLVVVSYVVANLLLAWHLSHGIASLFQTLGVRHERFTPLIEKGGFWLAALLGAGFISIPVSIRLGLVATGGGS